MRINRFYDTVKLVEEVVGTKCVQRLYYEELQKDLLGMLDKVLHGVGARAQLTSRSGGTSQSSVGISVHRDFEEGRTS